MSDNIQKLMENLHRSQQYIADLEKENEVLRKQLDDSITNFHEYVDTTNELITKLINEVGRMNYKKSQYCGNSKKTIIKVRPRFSKSTSKIKNMRYGIIPRMRKEDDM